MMRELMSFLARVALVTVVIVVAALSIVDRSPRERVRAAPAPRVKNAAPPAIEAEAVLFRTVSGAEVDDTKRRNTAHPRTIATFRALRAYPGAPPRIPHGLTADEFRTTQCRTCHERGGYSMRFEAYAPVTPHPQLLDCLQCHLASDDVTGIKLPSREPDGLCRQCHKPGARTQKADPAWTTTAWPIVGRAREDASPPPIPHDLFMRSECVTCHTGPGAVAEIRTRHGDRVSCRQCHLTVSDEAEYQRSRGAQ